MKHLSFLLVLSPVLITTNKISNFEEYSTLPDTSCEATLSVNNYYNYYVDSTTNVTFDAVKGWTVISHEKCNPETDPTRCGTYSLQAVRKYPSPLSKCTYCPYHLDPYWYTDNKYLDLTKKDDPLYPMYGPCLENLPSMKMVCLQHHALFPQKFFGTYFYPQQRPLSGSLWQEYFNVEDNFDYPEHQFLSYGGTESTYDIYNHVIPPTAYGLGKEAVISDLGKIKFIYKGNRSVNIQLTEEFKVPYNLYDDRVEQWMKWAQYYCMPGCHRNTRYSLFRVRSVDIEGDPELAYLSIFIDDDLSRLHACRPCPPYTASYNWIDYGPAHPRTNILADQCYPWFGSIPIMVPLGQSYIMNVSITKWNPSIDKVVLPNTDYDVYLSICPVNTYNRICAHTKEYIYNAAHDTNPPSTEKMKQYACTQCPTGYHTNGKVGQWYCVPPIGKIFVQGEMLQANPNVWGDRNLMTYELECGPRMRRHSAITSAKP